MTFFLVNKFFFVGLWEGILRGGETRMGILIFEAHDISMTIRGKRDWVSCNEINEGEYIIDAINCCNYVGAGVYIRNNNMGGIK